MNPFGLSLVVSVVLATLKMVDVYDAGSWGFVFGIIPLVGLLACLMCMALWILGVAVFVAVTGLKEAPRVPSYRRGRK